MSPHRLRARPSLRDRLASKRALVGFLQTLPGTSVSELAALSGYDFVILDGEHGLFDDKDYLQTLQALSSRDIAAWVRPSGHDAHAIGRYLDMGIDGVVVPNVSTPEQARALVRAMEYPPLGTRGFAASMHRTTEYGRETQAHLEAPRGNASLIVMIESALGVANAVDILAVDGVDGVFIGPFDLSADLGRAGDFSQPAYADALARVEKAAASHSKICGTGAHAQFTIPVLVARGHRMLLIGGDTSLIREAMSAQVAAAKAHL